MNIVYIHTHDLGRCISPYGFAAPTPHLAAFARRAALFRHAYSAAPTCSPSRAAMLTGMSPHACGMIGLVNRGFRLDEQARRRHLAHVLRDHGYETVLAGVQHECPGAEVEALGYARRLEPAGSAGEHRDIRVAAAAAAYLRGGPRRPFFLAFGMGATHRDYPALGPEDDPDHVQPPHGLPDTAEVREDTARFFRATSIVDRGAGMVVDALAEAGLDGETVVLFTTDHGIAFPRFKCNLLDAGIGVAMMLRCPGNALAGRATDALVSQLDVYPTLCALTGIEAPEWLEGHCLLPILQGQKESVRSDLYAEVTYHAAYEPMRCVRTRRHKLIRLYDGVDRVVPANIDDGPTKALLMDAGLGERPRDPEMLFDLLLDPDERVNRVGDMSYAEVRADLAGRLDRWMRRTADPLLAGGRVPAPPGTRVNTRTSPSPRTPEFEGES